MTQRPLLKKWDSENQNITRLKVVEAGNTVRDVCRARDQRSNLPSIKSKYGGIGIADIRRSSALARVYSVLTKSGQRT